MKKYDIVIDGVLTKENVRYNVCGCCSGPSITHGDILLLDEGERREHCIYERIYTIPIYNGRFSKLGNASYIVDEVNFTVTHSVEILDLSLIECQQNLANCIESYYEGSSNVDNEGYDLDAIKMTHIDAIMAMTDRSEAVAHDVESGWPVGYNAPC